MKKILCTFNEHFARFPGYGTCDGCGYEGFISVGTQSMENSII